MIAYPSNSGGEVINLAVLPGWPDPASKSLILEPRPWPATVAFGIGPGICCACGSGDTTWLVNFYSQETGYSSGLLPRPARSGVDCAAMKPVNIEVRYTSAAISPYVTTQPLGNP